MASPRRHGTPPGAPLRRGRHGALRIDGRQRVLPAANDNVEPLPRRLHRLLPFAATAALIAAMLWGLVG